MLLSGGVAALDLCCRPSCPFAEAIFEQLRKPQYSSHSVLASYLEIYNEELSDLLIEEVHAGLG